jgi:uncharacterized membrane protein YqjE
MAVQRMPIDPDVGIPDLIHRLSDDSKRLVSDEVRLAKLEASESVRRAGRGVVWLGIAFGIGVVGMVAFTLFVATLIGRLVNGHMWLGALVAGVIDLALAAWLVMRGIGALKKPSYTLVETRETVAETAHWIRAVK